VLTPCSLHVPAAGTTIKVAEGQAWPCTEGQELHSRPLPKGYARVSVDRLVGGSRNVKLDMPTEDGKARLGDCLGSFIPWRKAYIKFNDDDDEADSPLRPDPTSPPSPPKRPPSPKPPARSPPQPSEEQNPPPPPASSPPRQSGRKRTASQMTSRSSGRRSSSSVKPRPPPPKLPYEETPEETAKHVQEEVRAHFRKPSPPPEKTSEEVGKELALAQSLSRPAPTLPSDYERTLHKKWADKKKADSDPPVPWERWPYEYGKPLVSPREERKLSTNLRRLHQWYLNYARDTRAIMFPVTFKKDVLHHESDGEKAEFKQIWVDLEELYQMFQRDAIDITMIRIWTL
jgi:hypothetical protein